MLESALWIRSEFLQGLSRDALKHFFCASYKKAKIIFKKMIAGHGGRKTAPRSGSGWSFSRFCPCGNVEAPPSARGVAAAPWTGETSGVSSPPLPLRRVTSRTACLPGVPWQHEVSWDTAGVPPQHHGPGPLMDGSGPLMCGVNS